MRSALLTLATVLLLTPTVGCEVEPKREAGLSVFMFPRRAAELDPTKMVHWGFVATEPNDHRRPVDRPTFQKAADLLAFYRSRPALERQNGLWVIVTHPNAYDPEEKVILEELKALCLQEHILLFLTRAKDLPNGWERVN